MAYQTDLNLTFLNIEHTKECSGNGNRTRTLFLASNKCTSNIVQPINTKIYFICVAFDNCKRIYMWIHKISLAMEFLQKENNFKRHFDALYSAVLLLLEVPFCLQRSSLLVPPLKQRLCYRRGGFERGCYLAAGCIPDPAAAEKTDVDHWWNIPIKDARSVTY